jgi:hypothetical protein
MPNWKIFAKEYIKSGKNFLLLPTTVKEVSLKNEIPVGFMPLELQKNYYEIQQPQSILDNVYKEIVQELNLVDSPKFRRNIELIAQAGYVSSFALPTSQITNNDIIDSTNKFFFLTANLATIKKLVYTEDKRKVFNRIINKHGLKQLINIRFVSYNGWKDYY